MGGSTTTTKTVGQKFAGLTIQTSLFGQPIPIGWGRFRATCNLLDYLDFKAVPHTKTTSTGGGKGGGGGSKTVDTTYTYKASIILGICEGPISGVNAVYKDAASYTGGSALSKSGLSLAIGSASQTAWSYLTSLHPDHALAYRTLAYAYAQGYDLGDTAGIANHSFEIDSSFQLGGGVYDCDPKVIISDLLTNTSYGVPGWSSALNGDWSDYSLYCRASNLLLSPYYDQQEPVTDILRRLLDITHSDCYFSEGLLKIKPYGDADVTGHGVTWHPNLTPIYDLDEDDFLSEVEIVVADQSDSYNSVSVEYLDRAAEYRANVEPAYDLDNVLLYGLRKDPSSQTWHEICDKDIARDAIQLYLQRQLYVRETYNFELPQDFVGLEPMDIVSLTTTVDGAKLNRQLVQIVQIDEDENGQDTLHVVAEGLPFTAAKASYGGFSGIGFGPALTAQPGDVEPHPLLFNPPTSLITSATGLEAWAAVAGQLDDWGGCYVWLSYDNVNYTRIGQINAPARYGVLTSTFHYSGDPETAYACNVDLTRSKGALATFSNAQADAGSSMCLISPYSLVTEVISYSTADLFAPYSYNLHNYIRRGYLGTQKGVTWFALNEFLRIDDAIFRYEFYPEDLGKTIYVKFQSFNLYGREVQDLALLSPYSLVLAKKAAMPGDPTGLAVAGSGGTTWTGANLNLVCDPILRAEKYVFEIYDSTGTTLIRSITTTTPSATYTAAQAAVDGAKRTYKIKVHGITAAGTGNSSAFLTVTNAAPAAVASPAASGGATTGTVTCSASSDPDLAGYVVFCASSSGFDPTTTGLVAVSGLPSVSIFGLAAGTYYARIAAYDLWTSDPTQLNLSSEVSFTVTSGGGSTPTGGGTGSGGSTGRPRSGSFIN